eukprot:TRINITY_DN8358_c0_g1_i19.p1 TRINITY_DN8358_c0_g1~~TRINITY_DN8358_c0_g1_i19.p1  ORF type:complete len:455 (+),score=140.55 TRINITY_DN8358_c0_g1_i19:139-1503(+)
MLKPSERSASPKEITTARLRNYNDPLIRTKMLATLRQRAKEISAPKSKDKAGSLGGNREEKKVQGAEELGEERDILEMCNLARNGKQVLDCKINEIFNTQQPAEVKRIVEPIDVSIRSSRHTTAKGSTGSRSKKQLIKILESVTRSRNVMLQNMQTNIKSKKKAEQLANHSCADAYSSLDRFFKNDREKTRGKVKISLNKMKGGKKALSYRAMRLERLPGNCLELVCEFFGNKSQILILSKRVLTAYSEFRLKEIGKQIAFREQTRCNDDSSSSGYELVRFLLTKKEKLFVLSERTRKQFNKIRPDNWQTACEMISEGTMSEGNLIVLKLLFGLMGLQWAYFDNFIEECQLFLQTGINSKVGDNRIVIADPVETFNFERENVERLWKVLFAEDLTKVDLPPKRRATFFDVVAAVVTEGLQFARLIDTNRMGDLELEELRRERAILENYIILFQV